MTSTRPFTIELTLLETVGPFFRIGFPRLLCWFQAIYLPSLQCDEGKVVVVVHEGQTTTWRELSRPVTRNQSLDVLGRLKALGLPGRLPEVEGVVDTSDSWSHLVLRGRVEEESFVVEINMHSSGFQGPDAETVRNLCRELFHLAGYSQYSSAIYGVEPKANQA